MGERHTRQGTPRTERAQMGDYLEDDHRDWPTRKSTAGGSAQTLPVIGVDGCWCGLRHGHPWPGGSEGLPHPRTKL